MSTIAFIGNTGGINYSSGLVNSFSKVASYHIQNKNGSWYLWISYIHNGWANKRSELWPNSWSDEFTKQEIELIAKKVIVNLIRREFK